MDNVPGAVLEQALAAHKKQDFNTAARLYNALLNENPYDEGLLFCLGDLYLRVEHTGLAVNLLSNLVQINPKHAQAWCNLGIGYRKEQRLFEAKRCWMQAIGIEGDTVEVCSNMAGLYSDNAQPEEALEWLDRALAIDPKMTEARWQRALALLTLRRWADGWDEYEHRLDLEHFHTREELGTPRWDWTPTEHLYIHGEQGIGDEVMFLSCLDEAIAIAGGEITIEVNRAVAPIVRQTWPSINVVTDPVPGPYTAKVAIGSLPVRLRRTTESFPGVPYLKPDEALVGHYRRLLEARGPGPYVAVAWLGGTKQTRVRDRSMSAEKFKPILDQFTCVSGQYEHNNPYVQREREEAGIVKLDDDCVGRDIHAQAALFKAVDFVVTVQQTAVHVAGAVGAPTFALIGNRPHWRYGLEGDMPWYQSVKFIRRGESENWGEVVERARRQLVRERRIRRAQSADARAA